MKKVILSAIIVLMAMGVAFAEMDEDQTAAQEPEVYSAESDEDQTATEEPEVYSAESDEDQTATEEPEVYSAESDEDQTAAEDEEIVTQPPTAMLDEVLSKKKASLEGTKWDIELKSMVTTDTGKKGKGKSEAITETDVISFTEGKVMSESLSSLGYVATGFSTRLEEDGTLIWETMQTSEEDGQAFWRGDIGPDGVMRGALSRRDLKENVKDYNFVGTVQSK